MTTKPETRSADDVVSDLEVGDEFTVRGRTFTIASRGATSGYGPTPDGRGERYEFKCWNARGTVVFVTIYPNSKVSVVGAR